MGMACMLLAAAELRPLLKFLMRVSAVENSSRVRKPSLSLSDLVLESWFCLMCIYIQIPYYDVKFIMRKLINLKGYRILNSFWRIFDSTL